MKKILILFALIIVIISVSGQSVDTIVNSKVMDMEKVHLTLKVKQLNEFIDRFNNNVSNSKLGLSKLNRSQNIRLLIDDSFYQNDSVISNNFIGSVIKDEFILAYNENNWYAQVECKVKYNGHNELVTLIMQIENDKDKKAKWVIKNVHIPFIKLASLNSSEYFINPVNNETNFSDLSQYLKPENVKYIADSSFTADNMTLFMFLIQSRLIKFTQVDSIIYNVYTPSYKFVINNYNRSGNTSGWLISNIKKDNTKVPVLNNSDTQIYNRRKNIEFINYIVKELIEQKDNL